MTRNILLHLLFFLFVFPVKSEYSFEEIKELVPKLIIKDEYSLFYKIFKYHVPYNENYNTTNISLQISSSNHLFTMFLYDNYSEIVQDQKGLFKNYILDVELRKEFYSLNNLNCNRDYYLVFFFNDNSYKTYIFPLQIVILNEVTNIINLSPLLSDYFEIIPRNINKSEILFYCFNKTKYASIQSIKGELLLKEDDNLIYNNSNAGFHELFEFKKNQKYYIYYKSSSSTRIVIQFYNESNFPKHDIMKRPIIVLGNFSYNIEIIDISEYNIGDYIVFHTYDIVTTFYSYEFDLSYQYKKYFNKSNFIKLGTYSGFNFIPIKKEKNDSSLLLKINSNSKANFLLDIYKKSKMKEITSDFKCNIKGPKLFLIDYYTINNLNSFGIESNISYCFFQQNLISTKKINERDYKNITLYKHKYLDEYLFKRVFIYFNSNSTKFLKFENFNFSILNINEYYYYSSSTILQYFQLCQGNESLKELYFYLSYKILGKIILFTPVFGSYDTFFIQEKEIKALSDFNFNNNNMQEIIFVQNSFDYGYLKIECKKPTMIRYFDGSLNSISILKSGLSYITSINKYIMSFTLEKKLINKIIPLKFILLDCKNDTYIELYLNGELNILNNTTPLEFSYKYEQYTDDLITFKNILKTELIVEIIIGFTFEDLGLYKKIDFVESLGYFNIEPKSGYIIKIPKEFNEELYDYSIVIPYIYYIDSIEIQINYDKIEYAVQLMGDINKRYERIFPLFKTNPYLGISKIDKYNDDKFFYISIYNKDDEYEQPIYIKKPKLFSEIQLNTINYLPKLIDENKKYYYRIRLPKANYDSLFLQYAKSSGQEEQIYLVKNSNQYYLLNGYANIPFVKNDLNEDNIYLNCFGFKDEEGFINLITSNDIFNFNPFTSEYKYKFNFDMHVQQVSGKNELSISINSYSYYNGQKPYKYYFLINYKSININEYIYDYFPIFSFLYNYKNFSQTEKQI